MSSRESYLANLRKELGFFAEQKRSKADCPGVFAPAGDDLILDRVKYRTHPEKQALLHILKENAVPLRLQVTVVNSFAAAARQIVTIVTSTSPEFSRTRQIIQHHHEDLARLQLWRQLADLPVQLHTSFTDDPDIREKTISSYIGITVPDWVVAQSATMVQLTGKGMPRSTSLVPSVHIGVMNIKHLLADLAELYALLRKNPPEHSFTFITGPSKTADIEAHMVHGAHGPREVHLLIIDEHMQEDTSPLKGSGLFADSGGG